MEYFPLGDLQKHMSKSGPMPETHVRTVIYQVLEGLHYMHREGFAHRDIKPGNILIKSQPPQKDWWVKLSDFGISKRIRAPTEMQSTVKGTREYMAPELLFPKSGVQVNNQACDMWSLGEMAHRMLAATAAFPSLDALFHCMIRPDSWRFQELGQHGASDSAESFICALMRPTPEHRLPSGKALEHEWIQPCKPSGVKLTPLRASTSIMQSNITTPGLVTNPAPNSWATISSGASALTLGQDQNLGVPIPEAISNSSNEPTTIQVEQPKPTGRIKDAARLASGSADKTVKIWDPATGACISTLKGHSGWVGSVAWSHDAARLASGSADETVKIWDAATGACISTLKGHSRSVESVAWSHDAARLASGSRHRTVKIWDPATGACISTLKGHSDSVGSVAWSHDAARLASGSADETVKIWDPATGACISTLKGHSGLVESVAWSHDAARLVSGSRDRTVKIWDPATGACVSTLKGHSYWVWSVAWSHDAARLASGSADKTVKIWDPATGACISTLEGHSGSVESVAWSHDADRLASGSRDRTVKIWDPATGACISTLKGHSYWVWSVAWLIGEKGAV
ncbi:WD40-repeat-containing domain protein [Lasiosphaeria miniovina]|uniref:WD40-repeat-containing domain protein n=1 Tax=Lasiosphaeria miniovina TaxID=1954250 RepID=A0AA40DNW3_9PEZI|nr:WD40-repeat-containing domain protein [Lasiosphaeria miniovina]KAK0710165.1 WD40-repeat-containing domain protein [Lasiosphaeria miniovina]